MNTRTKKQNFAYWFLAIATFVMYIVLTGSKNLYTAEKTTMGAFFDPVDLASTMEYYCYSYAAMQIILVFLMKKINIKWYLAITITISGILTALMSFTDTIIQQWVLYIVNGAMQAGIWGCTIKVLSKYLPADILPKANALMTSGPAVAYFISYGTAALFGENWTFPFILLGSLLVVCVAVFFIAVNLANKYPREVEYHHVVHADGTEEDVMEEDKNDFIHLKSKKRKIVFYVISVFFGLLVTFLYFALNANVDYFINILGGFDNTTAKAISIVILVLTVAGPILTVRFCEKYTNFLKVGLVFFGIALLCSIVLLVLYSLNVNHFILLVLFYVIFLVTVNGGRSISMSIAALRMRDKIDTGVYSTMVNAAASISAGLAPKVFVLLINPKVTDPLLIHQNWINAFTMAVILGTVTVLGILALIIWIKRLNKKDALIDSLQENK